VWLSPSGMGPSVFCSRRSARPRSLALLGSGCVCPNAACIKPLASFCLLPEVSRGGRCPRWSREVCRTALPGRNRCVPLGGVTGCSTRGAPRRACRSAGNRIQGRRAWLWWNGSKPRHALRTWHSGTHRWASNFLPSLCMCGPWESLWQAPMPVSARRFNSRLSARWTDIDVAVLLLPSLQRPR
jgi:hypothetical protein